MIFFLNSHTVTFLSVATGKENLHLNMMGKKEEEEDMHKDKLRQGIEKRGKEWSSKCLSQIFRRVLKHMYVTFCVNRPKIVDLDKEHTHKL